MHPSRPGNEQFLSHWIKCKEAGEPYAFSKFDKKIEVIDPTETELKSI